MRGKRVKESLHLPNNEDVSNKLSVVVKVILWSFLCLDISFLL